FAYKKAENKKAFKQERYHECKEYDVAKRDMNYLKKNYGITDEAELHYKLSINTSLFASISSSSVRETLSLYS
ncbi:hypothetical protein ACUOFC_67515, partial [Escherichia sp. TWPC-MK]